MPLCECIGLTVNYHPKVMVLEQVLVPAVTRFSKTTMINLHACYCALFADIEQKLPFLFAGIK